MYKEIWGHNEKQMLCLTLEVNIRQYAVWHNVFSLIVYKWLYQIIVFNILIEWSVPHGNFIIFV